MPTKVRKTPSAQRTGKSVAIGKGYDVRDQVGYLLRTASQRHAVIFNDHMVENLTRQQFGALARLLELGFESQNELGRATDMDRATIKGVVDRLSERGYVERIDDPRDRRRAVIGLTKEGRRVAENAVEIARSITDRTLEPLSPEEATQLLTLLRRIS